MYIIGVGGDMNTAHLTPMEGTKLLLGVGILHPKTSEAIANKY